MWDLSAKLFDLDDPAKSSTVSNEAIGQTCMIRILPKKKVGRPRVVITK